MEHYTKKNRKQLTPEVGMMMIDSTVSAIPSDSDDDCNIITIEQSGSVYNKELMSKCRNQDMDDDVDLEGMSEEQTFGKTKFGSFLYYIKKSIRIKIDEIINGDEEEESSSIGLTKVVRGILGYTTNVVNDVQEVCTSTRISEAFNDFIVNNVEHITTMNAIFPTDFGQALEKTARLARKKTAMNLNDQGSPALLDVYYINDNELVKDNCKLFIRKTGIS